LPDLPLKILREWKRLWEYLAILAEGQAALVRVHHAANDIPLAVLLAVIVKLPARATAALVTTHQQTKRLQLPSLHLGAY
jgi:hypothetical protein